MPFKKVILLLAVLIVLHLHSVLADDLGPTNGLAWASIGFGSIYPPRREEDERRGTTIWKPPSPAKPIWARPAPAPVFQ